MKTATDQNLSYDELIIENQRLRSEVANLKRMIFGQKRERYVPERNEHQLSFLSSEDQLQTAVQYEKIPSYTRRKKAKNKKHPVRQAIPEHIPRKEIVIEPGQDTTGLKKIGEEITEELEYIPGKFFVNRYVRPKYALPKDDGVIIGSLPSRPIEKGIAGPGLLAHVTMSKYIDHLPLYRQIQQFKRLGIELAESTLCGWIKAATELLKPLVVLQKQIVLQCDYLMVDETIIKVLDPEIKGKTHQGYYWVYFDPLGKQVFFDYQKGRSQDVPVEILKGFSGHLQTDGYAGYNELIAKKRVIPVGCMAHARRYFEKALDNEKNLASWMLGQMRGLYQIERYARENNLTHEQRHELRQEKARPIMDSMKEWLDEKSLTGLPQNQITQAINYTRNQWFRLEVYLSDGRLEIDNNWVENAIRPVALGRKNYLFAGSHKGAGRAADLYTLVSNIKLRGIEPFTYLQDVLRRIADHPYKQLDQLLPKNWEIPDTS